MTSSSLWLVLDGAQDPACAALVGDGAVLAERAARSGPGQATQLPALVAALLAATGHRAVALSGIAVTTGPGSFTGLRAAIALAQGLGAGLGCPVVGIGTADALAETVAATERREVWIALAARRGRVFLRGGGPVRAATLDGLPLPERPVIVCGNAAPEVAAILAGRGADVAVSPVRAPSLLAVAAVAQRRRAEGSVEPPLPLYVDAPEAREPASPRAAPA